MLVFGIWLAVSCVLFVFFSDTLFNSDLEVWERTLLFWSFILWPLVIVGAVVLFGGQFLFITTPKSFYKAYKVWREYAKKDDSQK